LEDASPARPEPRHLTPRTIYGALGGLLLGILATFVLSHSIQRFQTIAAVKKALSLPILGRILADRWATHRRTVLDCDRHHYAFAESFRNLRSGMLNLPGEIRSKRCFSITSAVPGEGKSVTAVNLSIALAATGTRTLLIDGDLRRGKLHELLAAGAGPGFSDLITRQNSVDQVVQTTRMPNLFLIAAGPRIPNIAEQLLSFGFGSLLVDLNQHFDFIVVDTPPVLAADDALTIAAATEWTMFVVRLGYSRPPHSHLAVDDLLARQIQVAGVVVNCVPRRMTGSHYYNYYSRQLENRPFAALPAPRS
jgi:polysaccharide biosynthesis transport protein